MQGARGQAERYAKALPVDHGWPPFLVIVDVGHCFELYADFSRTGKNYTQFPDAQRFRIPLDDLRDAKVRERLRLIWTDPLALDPTRRAAEVTRVVAHRLAALAAPSRRKATAKARGRLPHALPVLHVRRGRRPAPREQLPRPAEDAARHATRSTSRPRSADALGRDGPRRAFSSTVLAPRRAALQRRPLRRHRGAAASSRTSSSTSSSTPPRPTGATSSPRSSAPSSNAPSTPASATSSAPTTRPGAYVERLVLPTVDRAAARPTGRTPRPPRSAYAVDGASRDAARQAVTAFHRQLCDTRVLDPACGSGNFLYVTLEAMKRLEGEVSTSSRSSGDTQTVLEPRRPHRRPAPVPRARDQPRAAAIAEARALDRLPAMALPHPRPRRPAEPVLQELPEHRAPRRRPRLRRATEPARGRARPPGHPLGRLTSMQADPATGARRPRPRPRVERPRYANPRPATWPEADFIIGNPPFIGAKGVRERLGDGYAEALVARLSRRCRRAPTS